MFTTSIANLLPGETVRVCFTYLDRAVFSEGKYSLTFPMVVAPRYVPNDASVTDAQRITAPLLRPSAASGHRVALRVGISGIPVERVTSNTHGINFKKVRGTEQQFEVTLREKLAAVEESAAAAELSASESRAGRTVAEEEAANLRAVVEAATADATVSKGEAHEAVAAAEEMKTEVETARAAVSDQALDHKVR